MHYKDAILDRLADHANIAQFVSYGPGEPSQRYSRIRELPSGRKFRSLDAGIQALLERSPEGRVNVRSYAPDDPKSKDFKYGLDTVAKARDQVLRLARSGLHTIVNETVDVKDGGVSGVVFGNLLDFAPDDTPRCVEKPGSAALPRGPGLRLLETVYGFAPRLDFPLGERIEFSIHPLPRGTRHERTIIWEMERDPAPRSKVHVEWPHIFSRFLGDKVFGLLVGDAIRLRVPSTTVISRRVAPFEFGRSSGTGVTWIRTCPSVQRPGKFTTLRGWTDPFALLQREDPQGDAIASVLAQEGVEAKHSGAFYVQANGRLKIEGIAGMGLTFMGEGARPQRLPAKVRQHVEGQYRIADKALGPVRGEWVHDGKRAWIVQLHAGASPSLGNVIYPGDPPRFRNFRVEKGLEALRDLVDGLDSDKWGVRLLGDVAVTSHFGDVLRRAKMPSRLVRPKRRTSGSAARRRR